MLLESLLVRGSPQYLYTHNNNEFLKYTNIHLTTDIRQGKVHSWSIKVLSLSLSTQPPNLYHYPPKPKPTEINPETETYTDHPLTQIRKVKSI